MSDQRVTNQNGDLTKKKQHEVGMSMIESLKDGDFIGVLKRFWLVGDLGQLDGSGKWW